MRNKWFVLAIAVPALLLAWWAISLWWHDNGLMAIVPGGLAAALFVGAYRVSQSASFSPSAKSTWGSGRSAGVTRWLAGRK
jgi:hypothetical protein